MTQCCEQTIQRYYQIFTDYTTIAKQIESCANEDKEFYQDICLLFAKKMKAMQDELTDRGFVFCQGSSNPYLCEKEA